jgi:hypothetical protein
VLILLLLGRRRHDWSTRPSLLRYPSSDTSEKSGNKEVNGDDFPPGRDGANVKDVVEDIISVLFIMAAGGLGFLFIAVALR